MQTIPPGRFAIPVACVTLVAAAVFTACNDGRSGSNETVASAASATPQAGAIQCDPANGGISLPAGYCASVFADNIGHARHLVVAPNGDVYVNTWTTDRTKTPPPAGGYIVALRDTDHDG